MAYIVRRVTKPDWDSIPKAYIESYKWGREYMPVSYGQVCFIENTGFAVRMTAFESEPKAVMTHYNDYVCKDSCLEFFVQFNNRSNYYMNFETNANGVFMAGYRTGRKDKTPIHEIVDINDIRVKATVEADRWYVEYVLTLPVIEKLFGKCDFAPGYTFRGNFYKCGDETAVEHYGSYYPVEAPAPDFHRPESFGDFVIE